MVFVVIALPIIEISYRTQTLFEAARILAAKEQQKTYPTSQEESRLERLSSDF